MADAVVPITLKRSTTAGAVPTAAGLRTAEPAINTADRKLYSKDATAVFQVAPSMVEHDAKLDRSGGDASAVVASAFSTSRTMAAWLAAAVYKDRDSQIANNFGFGVAAHPNAWINIGDGPATITDSGKMGLRIRVQADATRVPSAIMCNTTITDGSSPNAARSVLFRTDTYDSVNDGSDRGDVVALWADHFMRAAGVRAGWGFNIYSKIVAGSGYRGTMVGGELAMGNDEPYAHKGGALSIIVNGDYSSRFGIKFGGATGLWQAEYNILMSSTTPPLTSAFRYGPLGLNVVPEGNPLFEIKANGEALHGPVATFGIIPGAAQPAIQVQRDVSAFPRAIIDTDGRYFSGNGAAAPDASWGRSGPTTFCVGLAAPCALTIGTAAAAGAGFPQMWQQSAVPAAPAAAGVRIYAKNVAGKTALFARFPTGAEVQVAIEP